MTIFEVLNFNRELLERLRRIGVRLEDTAYIDLFVDYNNMVGAGDKVSYAVAVLADKYDVSERKVYSLIKHFQSSALPLCPAKNDCNPGAV